MFRE